MALTLIGSDQPISAAKWNEFFAEVDRKIVLVMDGKSLMLHPDFDDADFRSIFGIFFLFIRERTTRTANFLPNQLTYDHAPFTEAAQTLAVSLFDSDKRVISLDAAVPLSFWQRIDSGAQGFFFNRSLEAHNRMFQEAGKSAASYWLFERPGTVNFRPEKISRYGQAEIVIEGAGWADFQMDQRWNKYNFFRFHNLTSYAVTVSFAGYHSLTIPRWESRCVRRSAVDSGYLDGYNYFQKFATGDPRVYEMPQSNATPWGSMGANNVISPALVYRFLDNVCGPSQLTDARPRVYRDPHELYDVADLYSQFPAITNAALIGDLLHHAGALNSVKITAGVAAKTTVQFPGYAQLKAGILAAEGVSVTQNADGTLTLGTTTGLTHDLWGVGTNLLGVPMGSLTAGITLPTACPASEDVVPLIAAVVSDVRTWTSFQAQGDGTVALGGNLSATAQVNTSRATSYSGNSTNAIMIHAWTVADILSLNAWGNAALPGQNTAMATFESRQLTLTPFGLKLAFSKRVPTRYHPIQSFNFNTNLWEPLGTLNLRLDTAAVEGTDIVYAKAISFDGYGWAAPSQPQAGLGVPVVARKAAFIGPRTSRITSACPSALLEFIPGTFTPGAASGLTYHHPSISGQPIGADGADFSVAPYSRSAKQSDITGITALRTLDLSYPTDFGNADIPYDFPIYADDVLSEYWRDSALSNYTAARAGYLTNNPSTVRAIRMNLLREHYNMLAVTVNALKKCLPFTYEMFERNLPVPNTVGPFGGAYCPANQYCSFARDSDASSFFRSIGVVRRGINSLPASFAAVKATEQMRVRFRTSYHASLKFVGHRIVHAASADTVYSRFEERLEIGETVASVEPATTFNLSLLTTEIFGVSGNLNDEFFWVTVEDVQTAAESFGFKWHYERQAVPYVLKVFTADRTASRRLYCSNPSTGIEQAEFFKVVELGPVVFNPPGAELNFDRTTFSDFYTDGNFAQMTECVDGETAEWIRGVEIVRLLDHRAGDELTSTANVTDVGIDLAAQAVFKIGFGDDEYRLLRQRSDIVRTTPFAVQTAATEIEPVRRRASILIQSWVSDGLERNGKLVLSRSPWITYNGEQFSRQSLTNALARLEFGPTVISLYAPPASVGSVVVETASGQQLVLSSRDVIPEIPDDLFTVDTTLTTVDSTLITSDDVGTYGTDGSSKEFAQDTLWVRDWPLALG